MNAKTFIVLKTEKDSHEFTFSMPLGCPLGVAYDSCVEILKDIVELSKQAAAQAARQETHEPEIVEPVNN